MEQAPSQLVDKRVFESEYAPLKWRTVLGWEKVGLVKVIRIGRKRYLLRAEIDQIIAEGTHQCANGWRRACLMNAAIPGPPGGTNSRGVG